MAKASLSRSPDGGCGQNPRGRSRRQNFDLEANLAYIPAAVLTTPARQYRIVAHVLFTILMPPKLHHQLVGGPGIDNNNNYYYYYAVDDAR